MLLNKGSPCWHDVVYAYALSEALGALVCLLASLIDYSVVCCIEAIFSIAKLCFMLVFAI